MGIEVRNENQQGTGTRTDPFLGDNLFLRAESEQEKVVGFQWSASTPGIDPNAFRIGNLDAGGISGRFANIRTPKFDEPTPVTVRVAVWGKQEDRTDAVVESFTRTFWIKKLVLPESHLNYGQKQKIRNAIGAYEGIQQRAEHAKQELQQLLAGLDE